MQRNDRHIAPRLLERYLAEECASAQGRRADILRTGPLLPRLIAWLVFLCVCGTPLSPSGAADSPEVPFRVGFGSSMFTDVNENDAKAAVKVWGALIAKEQNVPTDPDPVIFKDMNAMFRSLADKQVDAVGLTTTEYAQLYQKIGFAPIFVTYSAGRVTEQYVLLAHRDGPVKDLADLDGRSLYLHTQSRACLAPLWLDTLLIKKGHPAASRFTSRIVPNTQLSKVVLPVFFQKADACVVTRSGFDTMCELNPQLARQLVVLAESSPMVPAVFAFRADYQPIFRQALIDGLNDLKKTPAGRQVLTIFHSEDIEEQSEDCLGTALQLIATHEQLKR
ncbi:MAG: PhnD/SsuA/transferrin family substrate-binding protein [Syntrophotaleaceae bacterium]